LPKINRIAAAGLLGSFLFAGAQAAPQDDWPNIGRDPGGARYSPLTQITPANVNNLKVAWKHDLKPAGSELRDTASQTTPLVVDGVLYLANPYGKIQALDGATGKEIWSYTLPDNQRPNTRGMGYWPGDGKNDPRLVFTTATGRLVAVNAKLGKAAEGFGDQNGMVNLRTPDVMRGFDGRPYGVSSAPLIYKNLAITGSAMGEIPKGPSGAVRAFDILTGKLVWSFKTVPGPGELGYDTWAPGATENRSGANVWGLMNVDAQRGIAYLPIGAPSSDRYGGDRHGTNLFSGSLVAVNAATGKYLWHFQLVHHDIWDHDMDTPPVLLTVRKNGRNIPAVATMTKSAYLFILDRVTGKPIYDVKEVPVPASTVTDEQAWPTQPMPVKPPPLARQSFSAAKDIATVTPEHKAFCEKLIKDKKLHDSVAYSPLTMDSRIARFPGSGGGPEWAGGAMDEKRGLFIINTHDMGSIEMVEKKKEGHWGSADGPDSFFVDEDKKLMCQQPPWGTLYAINVNTGDIAWSTRLGVTDSLPEGSRNTGRPSIGGPTVTAGGLIFIAATDDSRFRAFETATGKEVWTYKMDLSAHASPMTYRGKDGKQYVAIVATGGSFIRSPTGPGSLMVFALP
jgi:quinoprotein glucose dehydrogenase